MERRCNVVIVTRTLLLCTLATLPVPQGSCDPEKTAISMDVSPGRFTDNTYYIVSGTEVNITCAVTSPVTTSSDLVISPDNYEKSILNSTSISCVIPYINETMNFACCVDGCRDPTLPSWFDDRIQSSVNLEVGNLPMYENLSCQKFVDENPICTWYAHESSNWTLQYSITDNTPKKNASQCWNVMCLGSCDVSAEGQYRCSIGNVTLLPNSIVFPYSIVLTGQNDYGVTEFNISMESYMSVTYRRMSSVSVQRVGPTWMDVVWPKPRAHVLVKDVYNSSYRVNVTAEGNVVMIEITNDTSIHLSTLHPYTNYTIRLQAKPMSVKLGVAVWSTPVALHIRTKESKPSQPPRVTPAGYSWSGDLKKLSIYWKAIPRESRNGEIVRYRVNIDNNTNTCEVPGNVYSHTWDMIDVDVGHVVTVAGGTKGTLSDPAQMVIHPANKDLPRVDYVIVEKVTPSSQMYKVSWMTSQKYVDLVTVVWRTDNDTSIVNNFGWTIHSNTSTQVNVSHGHTGGDLWIGVALTFRNLTHGIMWNKCIFDMDEENHAPTPDVTATAREVHVHWGHIFCDRQVMKSRPLFYVVIYTIKSPNKPCVCDHGPNITIPAHFNTSSIVIDNLKNSESYCICLRIRTKRGLGPPSSAVVARLQNQEPNTFSTKIKVLVGLFSVLILVFIILVIKCLYRRYNQASYPIDSTLWKDIGENTNGEVRKDADGEMNNVSGGEVGENNTGLGLMQHTSSPTRYRDFPPPHQSSLPPRGPPTTEVDGMKHTLKHNEELGPKFDNVPEHRSSLETERQNSLTNHGGEELINDRDNMSKTTRQVTKGGYILSFNHNVGTPMSRLKSPSVTDLEESQSTGHNPGRASLCFMRDEEGASGDVELVVVKHSSHTDYVLFS